MKKKNTSILPYKWEEIIILHIIWDLAGLIEGDGHIAVHDKNSKSKKFRPKIIIVFNLADKPLASPLLSPEASAGLGWNLGYGVVWGGGQIEN